NVRPWNPVESCQPESYRLVFDLRRTSTETTLATQQVDFSIDWLTSPTGADGVIVSADFDLNGVNPLNDLEVRATLQGNPDNECNVVASPGTLTEPIDLTAGLGTVYTFNSSTDGFQPETISGVSWITSATMTNANGYLKLQSTNNVNNYGAWVHPLTIPVEAGMLYRVRYRVRSNDFSSDVDLVRVPSMRLVALTDGFRMARIQGVASKSQTPIPRNLSPPQATQSPGYREYDCLVYPEPNSTKMLLRFELINFDPGDSSVGEIWLDQLSIEGINPAALVWAQVFAYNSFAPGDGWSPIDQRAAEFAPVNTSRAQGFLVMQSTANGSQGSYGGWYRDALPATFDENKIYRLLVEIGTDQDPAQRAKIPALQIHLSGLAEELLQIYPGPDGLYLPPQLQTITYPLYFYALQQHVQDGSGNLFGGVFIMNVDFYTSPATTFFIHSIVLEETPLCGLPGGYLYKTGQ
ncbi:MAG: hypothetical protein V2A74_11950, partial [bacterium]